MAALVWPNIVRYSIEHFLQGQDVVNVLDLEVPGEGDRETSAYIVAGHILDAWSDTIMPGVSERLQAQRVSWVDLNSSAGSTGSRSVTADNTWPLSGSVTSGDLPNNVALIGRKRIAGKTRQQREGSIRIAGLPKNNVENNAGIYLTSAALAGWNDTFATFLGLVNNPETGDLGQQVGVLHTVARVATGFSPVASITADGTVGTQRRRMPGYGT